MPTYRFRNKETNEEFDLFMSMSDREKYLEDNPNLVQTFDTAPLTVSGVDRKPDQGFRDLLKDMKKKNSGGISRSTINTF